jgi:hypothetical protein
MSTYEHEHKPIGQHVRPLTVIIYGDFFFMVHDNAGSVFRGIQLVIMGNI